MAENITIDTILTYNNIGSPYLSIKKFIDDKITELINIPFKMEQLDQNGLPVNIDGLVENIIEVINSNNCHNVLLLLNATQVFKATYLTPNVKDKKAEKLHQQLLKDDYKDIENYFNFTSNFKTNFGFVFYDYLVDQKIIEYFQKVCKMCNCECVEFDLLANYILKIFQQQIKDNVAVFYKENNVITLILSIDGRLSSFSVFSDIDTNYNVEIFKTIDKHFFELEKKAVTQFYANYSNKELEKYNTTIFSLTYANQVSGIKL